MTLRRGVIAAALVLLSAAPVAAQETGNPARSLEQVERDLAAARQRERDLATQAETQIRAIESLRVELADAALATQEHESDLSAIEARLAGLDAEFGARLADFTRRRDDLAQLLNALQRLARTPPAALAFLPSTPVDAVRTAKLLGSVVPPLEAETRELAGEAAQVRSVQDAAFAERLRLRDAAARLTDSREHLAALIDQRAQIYRTLEAAHEDATSRVETLAAQAADLRDLLRRLDDEKAAARSATAPNLQARVTDGLAGKLRRLGEPRGQMAYPARGRVVLSYGQSGASGQPTRGVVLQTRPGAQIIAPFDGSIAFAGPFRGYGRILIIEHGEGYHTLLAGLGRIDVSPGQIVATGEPIATAEDSGDDNFFDLGATETGEPVLYVELRYRGQPINPLPWLAASNGKVSG